MGGTKNSLLIRKQLQKKPKRLKLSPALPCPGSDVVAGVEGVSMVSAKHMLPIAKQL
jgi:hypothetical protein